MASRFAHLSQRDSSVAMLRVKMSRRRSQAQKENRDQAVSLHRGLHRLPDLHDVVVVVGQPEDATALAVKGDKKPSMAMEERRKMLARYKEAKELRKEKERRAQEKKGVAFKAGGIYKPQPLAPLPQVRAGAKATLTVPSHKVTLSSKPQPPWKPLAQRRNASAPRKVKPQVALTSQPAPPAGGSGTAPAERVAGAPAVFFFTGNAGPQPQAVESKPAPAPAPEEEVEGSEVEVQSHVTLSPACPPGGGGEPPQPDAVEDEGPPSPSSPGFVFEPPSGLSLFLNALLDPLSEDSVPTSCPREDMPTAVAFRPPSTPLSCPKPSCSSPPPPHPYPSTPLSCPKSSCPSPTPLSCPEPSCSSPPPPHPYPSTPLSCPEPSCSSPPPPHPYPSTPLSCPKSSCSSPPPPHPYPSTPLSCPKSSCSSPPPPHPYPSTPLSCPKSSCSSPPPPHPYPSTPLSCPKSSCPSPAPLSCPEPSCPSPAPLSCPEPSCSSPAPCPKPSSPSPPHPNPSTPQSPSTCMEAEHDVSYFRTAMVRETGRLTVLCEQWEPRTEEPSIPEEIRERVRTAVGQARLLMRERFGQFQGLVDDCALGRGEQVTTCTDLQGFWEMVFYQVEDVNRKFSVLEEVESRGWKEELKPVPRKKRAAKKPPLAAAGGAAVSSAAARSRLAAVKAAMKAKREAEAQSTAETPAGAGEGQPAADAQTVVFHGGFFQVESPAKVLGSMRRTSLLRVASSPCTPSQVRTPRRGLHPSALRLSPAPGVTPTRRTNSALFGSPCLSPRPTAPPGSPSPKRTQNARREEHSGVPYEDVQPAPCLLSPSPCHLTPAPCPANSTPCHGSPTPCHVSPNPSPLKPTSCPLSPAPCPAHPAPTYQSDHDYAQLASPSEKLELKAAGQSASTSPSPQEVTSQSGIAEVYLEPLLPVVDSCSQSQLLPEVTDASCGQLELVAKPEVGGSPPALLGTLTPSRQEGAVEDLSECQPCERSAYSPSQWQGLNFTLSPSAYPSTPTRGLLLSPQDTSQSGIAEVYLEPFLPLEDSLRQSKLVPEVTDALRGQSEIVAEPEVGGSLPVQLGALTPSRQVGAVEDLSGHPSPCERSAYSPSQWQGLNFTLSPSVYPSTPTRGLLLSPDVPSPIVQSPPSTPRPLPLPLSDRSPGGGAQMGPAVETSGTADVPRLDFDSCVPPGVKCRLSPRATVAMETPPDDVPMESPGHGREDELEGEELEDAE
ncbi:disks large-associated protein 5-like isoform X2 [Conger conger]|uniref:disks large-associated protein 5-like isoform X2 n=1 Tax=Conger conger TaxID=82655 RepID=UPI002A59A946|nr:disks large-associated protein 5-like isoform X2 [Conger conger]